MVQPTPLHYVKPRRARPDALLQLWQTFLALNGVLQTPLKDLNGSVDTKGMTLSTVATTSGRCASRKEATDGSLV